MRVIQYAYSFLPVYGGEENYILALKQFLEKEGFETVVIQRDFGVSGKGVKTVKTLKPKKRENILDRHFVYPIVSFRTLSKTVEKGDLVIVHYPNLFFPSAWLLRKKCRTICVSHGVIWDKPSMGLLEKLFFLYMKLLHKIAAKSCNVIVANDRNYSKFVKSVYIPNFVDTRYFKPGGRKKNVIICARNLQYKRGVDLAIEAVKGLDAQLWICGDGPEKERLEALAGKNVKFFGRVDKKRLRQLYHKASIAVVPSRYGEGTSLSALEAMASGLPVVVTNVGGLPDLVRDGEEGFVVRPDAGEIRKAIQKAFKQRLKMGKAARKRAEEFSYEKWCEKWLQVISRL